MIKDGKLVGIISNYFVPFENNTVACTWLGQFHIRIFIARALEEEKKKE